MRFCAATREALPEAALIRFVAGPDGALVPDLAARLPGRGVWVRADRSSVALARRKGAFARGLKAGVRVAEDLEDALEAAFSARALGLLGLGKRAGALAVGFRQVEEALRKPPTFGLVHASDGSQDGRERLYKLARAASGGAVFLVECFTAQELGVALGRDHVVHACWLQERMARRWAEEIRRLSGFRAIHSAPWRTETSRDFMRGSEPSEGPAPPSAAMEPNMGRASEAPLRTFAAEASPGDTPEDGPKNVNRTSSHGPE